MPDEDAGKLQVLQGRRTQLRRKVTISAKKVMEAVEQSDINSARVALHSLKRLYETLEEITGRCHEFDNPTLDVDAEDSREEEYLTRFSTAEIAVQMLT